MLETSNEVDEKKVTNENNISLSRDTTVLLPLSIVDTFDKQNIFLMIEAEGNPQKTPLKI